MVEQRPLDSSAHCASSAHGEHADAPEVGTHTRLVSGGMKKPSSHAVATHTATPPSTRHSVALENKTTLSQSRLQIPQCASLT
jgi:hypothetical protein